MPDARIHGGPMGSLYAEHLALGASFGDGRVPRGYAGEPDLPALQDARSEGALLCDVGDVAMLLFGGTPAQSFAQAAFAGRVLAVGECAFEAVLTGDGSVASVPLLMRTGPSEYVCLDLSRRSEVLDGWLSFLGGISQDGVEPFAGLITEEVTASHAVLLLWGAGARRVLGDYVAPGASLPAAGHVASCNLDRIPCIVCAVPVQKDTAYVVLVPPVHAVALWRSLLSFVEVTPVGRDALLDLVHKDLAWSARLTTVDALRIDGATLRGEGLVRGDQTFVGARGLYDAERQV